VPCDSPVCPNRGPSVAAVVEELVYAVERPAVKPAPDPLVRADDAAAIAVLEALRDHRSTRRHRRSSKEMSVEGGALDSLLV
jgi:hypothetical protein